MKYSDSGAFCMIYIEPDDDRAVVFASIGDQQKPVVLMLPVSGRARAFARPEDFSDLKHIRRQQQLTILFVIPHNEHLRQLAARNGFPAYASIDALSDILARGQSMFAHQSARPRSAAKTIPLAPRTPAPTFSPHASSYRTPTAPLSQQKKQSSPEYAGPKRTVKLSQSAPLSAPVAAPPRQAAYNGHQALDTTLRTPNAPPRKRRRGLLTAMLVSLLLLLAGGAGLGYYFVYAHASPAPTVSNAPQPVGELHFLSSGQISQTSNVGLNDEVQLDLHDLQSPAPGNSFYAWLLSDTSQGDTTVVPLGKLTISQGSAHLFYMGDAQHTNLLAITSRFLITEEASTPTPIAPSPDFSTWRYDGIISQTPNAQDPEHFSLLDHLRHLLASDPLLNELELPGGLCNWFYRNTNKLLEWTTSARDNWQQTRDDGFIRRQSLRVLSYLDGLAFVQQDLPPGMVLPENSSLASVGLVDVQGVNQQPPSYLTHILHHLNGLVNAPGSTPDQRKTDAQIIEAMSNVRQWLNQLRTDVKQLLNMNNAQLAQPAAYALLNDMANQASAAYTGETDPATGTLREGVIWIHASIQSLASMDIYRYVPGNQTPEVVPATQISLGHAQNKNTP
jgi:hypothetical protein